MSPDMLVPVFCALLVCVFATLLLLICLRRKKSVVLILGICDAGKTTLFTNLIHNCPLPCYTSLKANVGQYRTGRKGLFLVDIPGHEKVRYECINKHKEDIMASVFIIDSTNVQSELKDVAEFMYNLLTDPKIGIPRSKILIICNKQDVTSAKGSAVIRSLLEKELNTLTLTRMDALASLDHHSPKTTPMRLMKPGSCFKFDTSHMDIEFVECAATEDISPVRKWLESL
ncbi:unnamed protein product [Calicophoron daubneyi]|uniref:Signal recognition particle receptor subunit beta n=1 Tax=Calicophoron daubneyi TaxID=300641 RepID=A0AAV2T0K4_CALDB